MSAVEQAKQSLQLIVIMSIAVGFLVCSGIDEWFRGETVKYTIQALLVVLSLVSVVVQVRKVCDLIR